MDITTYIIPARITKGGEDIVILTPPSKLKIQVTAPGAQTLFDMAPPQGKQWRVLVRVDIVETNE